MDWRPDYETGLDDMDNDTNRKPTIPEVAELFARYYEQPGNAVWGSLHIVLDDGNVDDSNVVFCIGEAEQRGDDEGKRLAEILLRMSKTQRRKLPTAVYGHIRGRVNSRTHDG